jgi:hypothetical protein
MSQRIVKWLAASAILAATGTAMGDTFNVLRPVIDVGTPNVEVLGPRSQFTFQVDNTGTAPNLAAAAEIDTLVLIGIDSAGNAVPGAMFTYTAAADMLPASQANGSINSTTIDLSASTNEDSVFLFPGVVGVRVRATVGADSVETTFSTDEAVDENFAVDFTPPTITSVFRQTGLDNTFFVVFSESLSLNGIGTNNAANETNPANLTEVDFERVVAMVGAPLTSTLSDQNFLSNNTVVRFDIGAVDDLAVGGVFRAVANNMDITDAFGNRISATAAAGTTISTPPAFTVTSAEWRSDFFGFASGGFAVVFSNPLATFGNSTFYAGPTGDPFLLSGSTSDIDFDSNGFADPANANAALLDICCGDDQVFADGRDFAGSTYTWNYSATTGTPPTDIFGSTLATAGSPFTIADEITPTQQFFSFHDVNRDGRIDAIGIAFDEPVTNNAAASTFTLRRTNGTVQPVQQITALGALTDDSVVASGTAADNIIPITSVVVGSIPFFDEFPTRIETNNGILINFNPDLVNWDNDAATAVGGPTEAIPGTGGEGGGGGCAVTIESAAGFTATDVALNATTPVAIAASPTTVDRGIPDMVFARFFTGDNQDDDDFGANFNTQLFGEVDDDTGNGLRNNRVAFVFSENLDNQDNGDNENQFRFGPGGINGFNDDGFVGDACLFCGSFVTQEPDNSITLRNDGENPALIPGVSVSILPQSGTTDFFGNEVLESDTVTTNRSSPYLILATDVNGSQIYSAFMFDTNANGFADSIRITMNQPIDTATVQVSDFSLSLGTITAVAVQGTDIVLTVTDGVIPQTSVDIGTYNGASDSTRIASLSTGGGTGVAVSAENFEFEIQRIAPPDQATQNLAFMDIVGTGMLTGTTPFPPGTKIFGMLAMPQIYSVSATHNNVPFSVNAYDDSSSLDAWNRWLFGSREFVYLGRNDENFQSYENDKDDFDTNDDDAINTYKDIIALTINATNLTNITFTGTGETAADKVTNGRARILWDVLRTDDGDIDELYSFYDGVEPFFGEPIRSSAVVLGSDGRFELHMSAPISAFDGKSRLSGIGRPVILVVELPDGKRFVVSTVTTSVNGAPILFNVQNRTQTAGQANNATIFNIQLDNVGMEHINTGWNLVPNNRAFGYAINAGARPIRPNGVSEANIFVPSAASPLQPFTSALHQFVIWGENNEDGMWTRDEDSSMSQFWVDPNVFDLFYFVMTSRGVQMGSAIDGFTGGYALAAFNTCLNYCQYGVFQFGAPLTGNTLFSGADAATTFPNNATTQGWGLFTSKAAFNPATAIGGTNNPDLDFLFIFRNNGNQAGSLNRPRIEVSSLDLLAPTGTDNPNDTTQIDAGQAFFGHFLVP